MSKPGENAGKRNNNSCNFLADVSWGSDRVCCLRWAHWGTHNHKNSQERQGFRPSFEKKVTRYTVLLESCTEYAGYTKCYSVKKEIPGSQQAEIHE